MNVIILYLQKWQFWGWERILNDNNYFMPQQGFGIIFSEYYIQ